MSSTILRVKRKLDENPQDALVLLCKRLKTDQEEISPNLFVFQGTLDSQENAHISNYVPKTNKLKSTHNVNDIINKIRQDHKDTSSHNRYEVVQCSRGLAKSDKELIDLVDLQRSDVQEDGAEYAYDLYLAAKRDFDVSMLENLVGIENYETELVFDTYRDNKDGSDSSVADDDDEDSNEENYYKNDYPDSEGSVGEEDMIRAMENHNIEDDLSSDDGEEQIYNDPPTEQFKEDSKRFGVWYARYKQKVMGELEDNSLVHCNRVTEVTEHSEGYKDDSDDGFYYGQEEDSSQFKEQYRMDSSDDNDPD